MRKILLTGGDGFIGKNLRQHWKNSESFIVFSPSHSELDLLDKKSVMEYIIGNKIDVIVHSANINSTRKKPTFEEQLYGNLCMFYNLAACSEMYEKMYYFGSGAEYDRDFYVPFINENYFGQHIPRDAYGLSKYIMSQACNAYINIYDLRLFGVYGPYEEYERRFISNAICRALKGLPITIERNVYFDYMWVGDLCRIMDILLNRKLREKHYNVCSGTRIDLYSLAKCVNNAVGRNNPIQISQGGYKKEYTGDNKLLLNEITNFTFTKHEEAIEELVRYYKKIIDSIDVNTL